MIDTWRWKECLWPSLTRYGSSLIFRIFRTPTQLVDSSVFHWRSPFSQDFFDLRMHTWSHQFRSRSNYITLTSGESRLTTDDEPHPLNFGSVVVYPKSEKIPRPNFLCRWDQMRKDHIGLENGERSSIGMKCSDRNISCAVMHVWEGSIFWRRTWRRERPLPSTIDRQSEKSSPVSYLHCYFHIDINQNHHFSVMITSKFDQHFLILQRE